MKQAMTFLVILAAVTCAMAKPPSEPPTQAPTVGPEVKKLGFFVGKWHGEGELKPGPFGPGGKYTEDQTSEWMPGGFFVVIHADEKSAMGNGTMLMVLGYDQDQKSYTFNAFNSSGEAETAKGTFDGSTWTWASTFNMGGKQLQTHFIMKVLSSSSYSTKFEMSQDGATWTTILEGKTTKVQ